jgi:hypothetical protein
MSLNNIKSNDSIGLERDCKNATSDACVIPNGVTGARMYDEHAIVIYADKFRTPHVTMVRLNSLTACTLTIGLICFEAIARSSAVTRFDNNLI